MSSNFSKSTPQKVVNRRSLDNSDCLDLSIKEFHFIIYYPNSDPGQEYEIVSEKDLEDTWDVLEKGAEVVVTFGRARIQGTVVTVSDDVDHLRTNFKSITQEHQETLLEHKFEIDRKRRCRDTRSPYVRREIIKIADKETQTEPSVDAVLCVPITDYIELKRKNEDMKRELASFTSIFSEIETGLGNTMLKLKSFKSRDESKSSSSQTSSKENADSKHVENKENVDSFNQMIQIGSEGTKVPKNIYDSITWTSYTTATRKLLITLFPRKVLATHSLTGKPSPAFLTSDKQKKRRLDPSIINDVVEIVSKKCKVPESLVRNAITTKCADENKLYRKRVEKRKICDTEKDSDEEQTACKI